MQNEKLIPIDYWKTLEIVMNPHTLLIVGLSKSESTKEALGY